MTDNNGREGSGVIVWGCCVLAIGVFLAGLLVGLVMRGGGH